LDTGAGVVWVWTIGGQASRAAAGPLMFFANNLALSTECRSIIMHIAYIQAKGQRCQRISREHIWPIEEQIRKVRMSGDSYDWPNRTAYHRAAPHIA